MRVVFTSMFLFVLMQYYIVFSLSGPFPECQNVGDNFCIIFHTTLQPLSIRCTIFSISGKGFSSTAYPAKGALGYSFANILNLFFV